MSLLQTCEANVALLSDYLDGTLGPWARFKVRVHLLFCPPCRALLATLAALGPLVEAAEGSEAPPAEALAALDAALDALAARPARGIPPGARELLDRGPDLPLALLAEAHRSLARSGVPAAGPLPIPREVLDQLPPEAQWTWEEQEGGLAMAGLLEAPGGGARLVLWHAPRGSQAPPHRHLGSESLLVLAGSLRDGERTLSPGDWAHYGPGSVHAPAVPGDGCWCLIRQEGAVERL